MFGASATVFAEGLGGVQPEPGAATNLVPCGKGGDPNECDFQQLYTLISNIWNFLILKILAPVAVIAIMFAGFKYVTAQGNPSKITEAHNIFYYVVIGMIIALGAWLIVNAILKGLGAKINFLGQ
jgi:hypothetical protein